MSFQNSVLVFTDRPYRKAYPFHDVVHLALTGSRKAVWSGALPIVSCESQLADQESLIRITFKQKSFLLKDNRTHLQARRPAPDSDIQTLAIQTLDNQTLSIQLLGIRTLARKRP